MSPMSPRLLRPRQSLHPEAADWAARVTAVGATYSGSTLTAVSKFCRDIDSAGIRSKFVRLNLFCGNSITAALIPIYRSSAYGGAVVGNATDTNNNFVSADYVETGSSSGLNSNGSTKFLNTGFPANAISASDAHIAVGLRATSDTGSYRSAAGVWDGGASGYIYQLAIRRGDSLRNCIFGKLNASPSNHFGEQANNANIATGDIVVAYPAMYRSGAAVGVSAAGSANYPSAHSLYVFALNNGSTSAAADYMTGRINWYSVGNTMTSAQVLSFTNAVAAFNSTLGRT